VQSFSYAAEITGTWKAIDDKTGYARADVEISKLNDGTHQGKVIRIHAIPNRPAHTYCSKCKGGTERCTYSGYLCLIRSKAKSRKEE